MKTLMIAATAALTLFAGTDALSAQTSLKDEPTVSEGLIAVGMAYEISEQCDGISARLFRGLSYLNGLKGEARDLGYSNSQIDAYVDDKAEKNRLEGVARDRLTQLGVVADDPASYCAVGRDQIAANTRVGWLLR